MKHCQRTTKEASMSVTKSGFFLSNFFLFLLISFQLFSSLKVTASSIQSSSLASVPITSTSTMNSATGTSSATDSDENKEENVPVWPTTGNRNILISGGAGYIGTHTIVCLLEGKGML